MSELRESRLDLRRMIGADFGPAEGELLTLFATLSLALANSKLSMIPLSSVFSVMVVMRLADVLLWDILDFGGRRFFGLTDIR